MSRSMILAAIAAVMLAVCINPAKVQAQQIHEQDKQNILQRIPDDSIALMLQLDELWATKGSSQQREFAAYYHNLIIFGFMRGEITGPQLRNLVIQKFNQLDQQDMQARLRQQQQQIERLEQQRRIEILQRPSTRQQREPINCMYLGGGMTSCQ